MENQTNSNSSLYKLFLKTNKDVAPWEDRMEVDTYDSLEDAKQDARRLYILHQKDSPTTQANDIDLEICDSNGAQLYSAYQDVWSVTKGQAKNSSIDQ